MVQTDMWEVAAYLLDQYGELGEPGYGCYDSLERTIARAATFFSFGILTNFLGKSKSYTSD